MKLRFRRMKKIVNIHNHLFAVTGTFSGVGVTLFCINFAYFLSEEFHRCVAVVELGNGGSFSELELQMQDSKHYVKTEYGFSLEQIAFFQNVSKQGFLNLLVNQYEFIIFDMGTNYMKHISELVSCNKKIVLGSHLEWRMCEYNRFLDSIEHLGGTHKWEYVDVTGTRTYKPYFIKDRKIKLKQLPRIVNVFSITDELRKTYYSFL